MNEERVRLLKSGIERQGPVLYWMSRDQRACDNWALLYARGLAVKRKVPLLVAFCLVPDFLGATARHYDFMLRGLRETDETLRRKNIPFYLLRGDPPSEIPALVNRLGVGVLVTDFDPLRIKRDWKRTVCDRVTVPIREVDAHNIVPCWRTSEKQEFGARTIRPKIRRHLPVFLEDFPPLRRIAGQWPGRCPDIDWRGLFRKAGGSADGGQGAGPAPGTKEGTKALREFIANGLGDYAVRRNDPVADGQSHLSPYLHFGQISAQRTALEVGKSGTDGPSKEAFLEELVVRRELADNFCFYNERYDSCEGFPAWARETLDRHRLDRRPYLYSLHEFENARTHDDLWNAAQTEMVRHGRMHGYMRMYWAKKILEWAESPEEAVRIAIYLNDRYELDGRDPNGYTGIAWSIGGVHDRAWGERKVFGKIRYMSYQGCRHKFDTDEYIRRCGVR